MNYLGIDIGGTKIKYVLLDHDGQVSGQDEMLTEDSASDPTIWKNKISELIERKAAEFPSGNLCYGISAPGLVDAANRQINYMPVRLQGIEMFNWSEYLDKDIWVLNDGDAACLAEYDSFYAEDGIQHLIMLTLGTGVGGGIIINGQIHQGYLQRAGHFGHTTVDHSRAPSMTNMAGSLETAVGNFSVKERTHNQFHSVKDLLEGYAKGDTLAVYWWLDSVQKLATGIASFINVLSPEVVVLGGGIAAGAGDALFDPLNEFMALYEWTPGGFVVPIEKAQYGNFAGAMGAALFAKKMSEQ